ncbi:MAG: hypothetical protein LBL25_00695 [Oscillospiraceae bacterium]|jgi:hypothetical protein|nr:hypothetical protein [Oscillospiraceae bacterium]
MDLSAISPILPYVPQAEPSPGNNISGEDFAAALSDAVSQDARQSAVALAGGLGADSAAFGGDLSGMLLASAANGVSDNNVSNSRLALFMLLQMMQGLSSNASGADAMYFAAMSAALAGSISNQGASAESRETPYAVGYDSASLRRPSAVEASAESSVRAVSGDSGDLPYGEPAASAAPGPRAKLPDAEWVPATPVIRNSAGNRSPENYNKLVRQFDVTAASRYAPGRNGHTYCNIFVWDVTRALGCEIPHYISSSGAPMEYPNTAGASELNALSMGRWLASSGKSYGWTEATPEQAQLHANLGKPAVAVSSAVSHISMVVPSAVEYDPRRGVTVAQAGSYVTNYSYLGNIYSNSGLKSVRYFVHE